MRVCFCSVAPCHGESACISHVPLFFFFFTWAGAGWDSFHPAVPGADFPWTPATTYGTQGSGPKMEPAPSIDLRNHQ